MNGKQISKALNQKQLNYAILAEACNTTISHIYNVANRNTTSKPIAEKIARALGMSLEDVFPEYKAKANFKRMRKQRVNELAKIVNS